MDDSFYYFASFLRRLTTPEMRLCRARIATGWPQLREADEIVDQWPPASGVEERPWVNSRHQNAI
jgi:hypothetical protein